MLWRDYTRNTYEYQYSPLGQYRFVSHTHDPVNAMTQFTESRDTQAGNDKMLTTTICRCICVASIKTRSTSIPDRPRDALCD